MKRIFAFVLMLAVFALCLTGCNSGPDFEDAFELRGLEFNQHELSTPERMDFAGLTTDDTLEVYELGYEGEVVKTIYKTLYLNVSQYDAAQRESIKGSMQASFAEMQSISGVTITHELSGDFYIMSAEIKGVDNVATLRAVVAAGLIDFVSESAEQAKAADAENVLIANGFIKR